MILQKKTLYEELERHLMEYIDRERPRTIPCERELMETYGVSRNTVRRAIQELTNKGVLCPVQGLGTLVYPTSSLGEDSTVLKLMGRQSFEFSRDAFACLSDNFDQYRINSISMSLDYEDPDTCVKRLERLFSTVKIDSVFYDYQSASCLPIHDLLKKMRKLCVCLRWKPIHFNENYVVEDLELGFYLIAKHLLELGHRKIALLGSFDGGCVEHTNGVRKAFKEFGVEIDPKLMGFFPSDRKEGYPVTRVVGFKCAQELLNKTRDFTAVICHNDTMALGVMEALMIAGLRIPEDVAITGFDNISEAKDFPVPLTTCGADLDKLVKEAISILFNHDSDGGFKSFVCKPKLVVRESTSKNK